MTTTAIINGRKRRVCWQHGKLFRKGKCPVCRRDSQLKQLEEAGRRYQAVRRAIK